MGHVTALSIGLAGALIAVGIGFPLPWMLGPMVLVTLAAIGGAPVKAPLQIRKVIMPILGVMLGSGFHPETFEQIAEWAETIAYIPLFVVMAFSAAFAVYRFIGRFDPITAYFSSAPGGLNDMMLIGAEAGGIERRIALAHASRVLIVVSSMSFIFWYFFEVRSTGQSTQSVGFADLSQQDYALLISCAVVGAFVGPKLRLPAAQVIGPMILSSLVHLAGLTQSAPPTAAVNVAQLVMGTVVGCRFLSVPISEIWRDIGLAIIATTGMMFAACLCAILVSQQTGIDIKQTLLTFAPGGLPEMSLLTLAMGADIAFVATAHIIRILLVIAAAPIMFRILKIRSRY
ncbi:AbrB family transcriptional regulator [Shimia sp. R9_1]|uniref:AbrB family transcriptional regulator n=1 Tax=Shimia sp. R9_1 TaxID=2821111 RepID=UPI001ADBED75|nr:AbrB family transcriptional regulator [Shimia sp. R9_1]MBO9409627.1 AbrB family transcriptional regulator [Shimia sp. R9_1]